MPIQKPEITGFPGHLCERQFPQTLPPAPGGRSLGTQQRKDDAKAPEGNNIQWGREQNSLKKSTKGQSCTDKGTSNEAGSQVGEHTQQHPAQVGIPFPWHICARQPKTGKNSYMQTVLQEAVPSGLSFSRNHFLKGEKRKKDKFLLMLLRNTPILEALLPMLSQLFESLLNVLPNHLILGYLQIKTNLVLKLNGT